MAVKSVIDVEINDEKFRDFLALFEKYQSSLGKMGGKWSEADKVVDDMASGMKDMTAAMMAQVELLNKENQERRKGEREEAAAERRRLDAEKATARAATDRQKAMKKTADDAKSVAKSVAGVAIGLAKWTLFGGAAGIVGGALGLWGIDRFASSVGDARRTAMGLGSTTGNVQSFGLNFGRVLDQGHLARVAEAQTSLADRWAFSPFGINPVGKDPAELAAQMLPKAVELFRRGGKTAEGASAFGLDKFYSMEELRRADQMSPGELASYQAKFREDQKQLKLQDAVSRKWQDLSVQLDRAKLGIKAAFVDGLVDLAPRLGELSARMEKFIRAFVNSENFDKFVNAVEGGLKRFGEYLSDGSLERDMTKLASGAREVADALVGVARWIKGALSWIPGTQEYKDMKAQQWENAPNWYKDPAGAAVGAVRNLGASFVKPVTDKQAERIAGLVAAPSKFDSAFKLAGMKYGVDWRELKMRAAIESDLDPTATGPKTKYGQAFGLMQVNASAHGVSPTDMLDPYKNIDRGSKIWADALRRSGGDPDKAAAIYYGSPGKPNSEQYALNSAAVRAKLGMAVAATAPRQNVAANDTESRAAAYADRRYGARPVAPGQLTININDRVGADISTSMNQAVPAR